MTWWGYGGQKCAVCGEPVAGIYDLLAHQVRHDVESQETEESSE